MVGDVADEAHVNVAVGNRRDRDQRAGGPKEHDDESNNERNQSTGSEFVALKFEHDAQRQQRQSDEVGPTQHRNQAEVVDVADGRHR